MLNLGRSYHLPATVLKEVNGVSRFPDEIEAWKRIREQSVEFNYCATCGKEGLKEWVDSAAGRECESCWEESINLANTTNMLEYITAKRKRNGDHEYGSCICAKGDCDDSSRSA